MRALKLVGIAAALVAYALYAQARAPASTSLLASGGHPLTALFGALGATVVVLKTSARSRHAVAFGQDEKTAAPDVAASSDERNEAATSGVASARRRASDMKAAIAAPTAVPVSDAQRLDAVLDRLAVLAARLEAVEARRSDEQLRASVSQLVDDLATVHAAVVGSKV